MPPSLSRRELLTAAGAVSTGAIFTMTETEALGAPKPKNRPYRLCLNTSTLRGHKLPFPEVISIAAKAGYDAIEPWIDEISNYQKGGGSLADIAKLLKDNGMTVEGGIGFAAWIVDDDSQRAKALEQAKRDMELVRQIGGAKIAAPPVGATEIANFNLHKAAERYRALLEVGREMGVVPMAEVWGFSKTMKSLAETAMVTIGSDHPDACILPDIYHLYKGGGGFNGLKLLDGKAIPVFHFNDYPASPPRETINDADRIYPGEGIAPTAQIMKDLKAIGFNGVLSVELFNKAYYAQPAEVVAKTAIERLRQVSKLA